MAVTIPYMIDVNNILPLSFIISAAFIDSFT